MTLDEFCKANELKPETIYNKGWDRYCAGFDKVVRIKVDHGEMLVSGYGSTREIAIEELKKVISNKMIWIGCCNFTEAPMIE